MQFHQSKMILVGFQDKNVGFPSHYFERPKKCQIIESLNHDKRNKRKSSILEGKA